jgi:starch phosphorylase
MKLNGTDGAAVSYEAKVPANRPAADYTVRVLPHHPDAQQPLDLPLVLWEH